MVELAPRLAPHMPARFNDQSWPALIETALWLSGETRYHIPPLPCRQAGNYSVIT
jgi:hypothetical protein